MRIPLPNMVLFKYSLRTDILQWQNYLSRLIMMIIILFILLEFVLPGAFRRSGSGLNFFVSISMINIVFINLLAVSFFSSAVTEEKEAESLALLLMTGLSPFTMLLSKSTSKLILGMTLIVAQIPFIVLAVTLGGVGLDQIFSVYLVILAHTVLLCSMALLPSVIFNETVTAACFTFLGIAAFHFSTAYWETLNFLSPFYAVIQMTRNYSFDIFVLVWNPAVNILVGAAIFVISFGLFNRFSRSGGKGGEGRIAALKQISGRNRFKGWLGAGRAWRYAFAWKEYFFTAGGKLTALSSAVTFAVLFAGIYIYFGYVKGDMSFKDLLWGILVVSIIACILKMIYVTGTFLGNEVWSKTLPALVILPVPIKRILRQKLAGGMLMLLPSLGFIALSIVLLIGMDFDNFCRDVDNIRLDEFFTESAMVTMSYLALYAIKLVFFFYLYAYVSMVVRYGSIVVAGLIFIGVGIALGLPGYILLATSAIMTGVGGSFLGGMSIGIMISAAGHLVGIFLLRSMSYRKIEQLAGSI